MLTTVGLFCFIMHEDPAWIETHRNSIWSRAKSHMTSHYTWKSLTTHHGFGVVLGRPLDTFLLGSHNFMVMAVGSCLNFEGGIPKGFLSVISKDCFVHTGMWNVSCICSYTSRKHGILGHCFWKTRRTINGHTRPFSNFLLFSLWIWHPYQWSGRFLA